MRLHAAGRGLAAVGTAVVLVACGGEPGVQPAPQPIPEPTVAVPTTPVPTVPAPTVPAPTGTGPEPPGPVPAQDPATPGTDLADGRHATFLRGIDVADRILTVDVIQFLTGAEAEEAYHRDHPEDPYGPPNDYYILNVNPRLRTLEVADGVQVRLVRLHEGRGTDTKPGTWEELPDYLAGYRPEDGSLSWNPFWIALSGGLVTGIEEQYIP